MLEALETQATGSGATAPGPAGAGLEGDRFGAYRILQLIGEGGMGSVYLAEQTHPIQRQVALKVVKLGMDTRQVVARFESERQALALMDHPNIAHVYEAGTSDPGRPYFVMEYVDGVPITQYCDQHLLNTGERLELFGPVCLALQHAHQKGVIHRDIKPSNVLVTEQDGKPCPKVIDFGIAKATDQRQAEFTAFTLMGNFAGTPEYMSPEQADLSSQDIDTTTDVYSLGMLLYELLVGALPFEGRWLREAGMSELLRIIREEDAPTPSAKLTKLGEMATEIARCRRTDPVTLRRQLAGDLNWIVMKALEKDRRRYASVSELAADIRRHLEDHPVLASPPGKMYRARKFVRRHRVSVAAGVVVAISLFVGMIGVIWEARIAETRRREADVHRARANAQAAQAGLERNRAEEKAREAEEQRKQAEELFGGVRDLANSMIFDVADQIAELQGATAARETLVKKAVEYLDRLSKDPRATPELRRELGAAYLKIGDLQARPVHASLEDSNAARLSYKRSVDLLESLAKTSPNDPKLAHLLIQAYQHRGRLQEDISMGIADFGRARKSSSIGLAVALAEARLAAEPKSAEARHDLASSLGAYGAAMTLQPAVAQNIILRRRALLQDLLKEGSKDPEVRRELAWTFHNQGSREMYSGDSSGAPIPHASVEAARRAIESFTEALTQFESLARDYPANAQYRRDQASTLWTIASVLQSLQRTSEAIDYARRSVIVQQQLADGDAQNASVRLELTRFQGMLAYLLGVVGKRQEAMDAARQALAGTERLISEQPANPQFRYERASRRIRLGTLVYSAGDRKAALQHYRGAESELAELVERHPDRADFRSLLAQSHMRVADCLRADGDHAGALAKSRQALAEWKRIAAGKSPGDASWFQVAMGHRWVAAGLGTLGDLAGAVRGGTKGNCAD
jgi:serine/threonine protein kinase